MAVFSAIAGAIGSVVSAIGAGVSGLVSAVGGLGGLAGVAGLVGTGISAYGAHKQARGLERAEKLRLRQSNLEASRARRNTVRQAIVARAQALSNATAQGAAESTGLAGGQAQIQGQAASNIQGINQGQSIGYDMFQANRQISSGQTLQSIGSGISGFGNWLTQNQQTMGRLFPA